MQSVLNMTMEQCAEYMATTLKEISDKEIEARDRVNISLKEYESMKDELARLKRERESMVGFMGELCRSFEESHKSLEVLDFIKPGTLNWWTNYNPDSIRKDYCIKFEIDVIEARRRGFEER